MELLRTFKRATKTLVAVEKAVETWDFRSFERSKFALAEQMKRLDGWEDHVAQMDAQLQQQQAFLESEVYRQELEAALRDSGLPLEGEFPDYRIPPFELKIACEEKVVRLRMGRKVESTGMFEPTALARWLRKRYDSVVRRSFPARRFFRNLLAAYRLANRLTFGAGSGSKVLWGKAVSLQLIYDLLTVRAETRGEYPVTYFVYDLARLRATGLTYDAYTLEFGFTRSARRSFLIPDLSTGREERFSTLTIHRK